MKERLYDPGDKVRDWSLGSIVLLESLGAYGLIFDWARREECT